MDEKTTTDVYNLVQEMRADVTILTAEVTATKVVVQRSDNTLRGHDGNPGLVEQVRNLTAWKKNIKYWYVLFVGVTVSAIVVGIINIALELGARSVIP